jgi:Cys-tRNA(Pro)/Cys-tRNA(Cys) deacylase
LVKTNVARILEASGFRFRTVEYEVDENDLSAHAAADKVGMPIEQIFKTLAVRGDKTGPFLACIPGNLELSLKKAAAASGNKSVEMLPLRELEPLTGYVRGGCSPVGTKKRLAVYIDETAQLYEEVSVSAGMRGLQMVLAPDDLLAAVRLGNLSAEWADLT